MSGTTGFGPQKKILWDTSAFLLDVVFMFLSDDVSTCVSLWSLWEDCPDHLVAPKKAHFVLALVASSLAGSFIQIYGIRSKRGMNEG